ncbi:MAG: DUF4160 domain-containing protein [Bacteroidales bacterium]|nr:DUF4160 domain-containing protein [Bacteroidales bacterium]MBR6279405.1 DUF4160 domain-containing protein [Bacteroidales bacterium]
MPKIYEYFGFIFYFYSNDHEPVHVHVQLGERESIFDIIMQNGVLSEIRKRYKKGMEPLKPEDEADVIEFIQVYYKNIIAKWVKFFVMKQKVRNTKITKRIKGNKK